MVHTGFGCGNLGVRSRLEDVCRFDDNINVDIEGIGLGPALDSSGRVQRQRAGCLNTFMYFGSIKFGKFFD